MLDKLDSMTFRPSHEWGPFLWGLIHTITVIDFDEPTAQRRAVEQAIHTLKGLPGAIPCHRCAEHFSKQVQTIDATDWLEPMSLFYWTVDVHNAINQKLGKPMMSREDALSKWSKQI